ncbi:hypothetical protein EDD11_008632 [Mortierella claussenii]|nr:hypothetical protein EDD11_008632 [Mortierella claussenii]
MTPLVFRNLTTLKSMFQSGSHLKAEENNNSLLQILTLVEASPRLETFEINHFIFKKHLVLRLATIIRNHPSLKNFSFKPKKYTRDLVLLLLNCGRLERLAIACCPMLGSREFRAEQTKALMGMPETNIRDLDFGGVSFWSQLDTMLVPFLRKCSKLKRFLFPSYYRPIDLAGLIRTHLPELSQLDFTNSGSDDGMFASAINACRTVEEFKGKMAVWASELTVRALIQPRHAVTLKEVCFANCVRIRGAHIQMILKSCPNLAGFHGMDTNHTVRPLHEDPVFCVADMESDPGEWTCKELKVLSLKYKETDEGETFPKIIYEQISRLTKLEHLFLERKILPALPATVATQSAAADATITADIPAPATSETSASPNTTTASWLSTAPVTEPLSEAAGSKMAIADTDINANNSGAKNKSEEERRRSNRSGDGTLEMDEQESTRDGKLEEALTSFVTLQRLRSLNMANLHGPFYKTQRQWLYENIPTLEYIALY